MKAAGNGGRTCCAISSAINGRIFDKQGVCGVKNRVTAGWPFAALCLLAVVVCASVAFAAEALPKRLSVTYVASPLNIPSIVERAEGRLQKAFPGVEIRLPDLNAGPNQTAAMAAGEVDIAHCLGATSAILAASEGLDIRIVGIYSRAPRAFMIMTSKPGIQSVGDLKGKKIGGPKGTILHQLLAAAVAKAGFKPSDYEFINMGLPAAAAALSNGSIDAALLAGPDAYRAAKAGARTLTDGVGLVDATTVIATTGAFLDKYPDAIRRFLKMHAETLDAIKKDKANALRLTENETKLPKEAVETMFPWYDFTPAIRPSDVEELKRTQDFMIENGLQRNRIDMDSIVVKN